MKRGGKILCGAAVLAVAACSGQTSKLQIRSTPTVLAKGEKPVPYRVAEGWGQLALNNVGLALQSFRMGLRDDPESTAALLGIATSYDKMGRFDLSRRHYEAALAIAPGDTRLLAALAASLDVQGRAAEAASVRGEIAQRLAASAPSAVATPEIVAVQAVLPDQAQAAALTSVAAVEAEPVLYARPAPAKAPEPVIDTPRSAETVAVPMAAAPRLARVELSAVVASAAPQLARSETPIVPAPVLTQPALVAASSPDAARSVTIKLPPPRPASAAPVETRSVEVAQADRPALVQLAGKRDRDTAPQGPKLVRLSRGEIALVTTGGPVWRSEPVSRTASSTTVRFVPVRSATRVTRVRLLNAARVHRLAARTRAYLAGRGWRGVSIGDAESTRSRSLILYPAGQRTVARKLSAQFGFAMAPNSRVRQVTVLLGRDSVRIAGARAGA